MSVRARIAAVIAVAAVLLGGAGIYMAAASASYQTRSNAPSTVSESEAGQAAPLAAGQVVFRNTAAGQGYGLVASVPLSDPSGPRQIGDIACDRVAATATTASCLHIDRGVVTSFVGTQYDARWQPVRSWPLAGIPSRTRISADGSRLATTAFVTGHAYAVTGFSTQTEIREESGAEHGNLEDFSIMVDGEPLVASDRNVWGVTFAADDTHFFATVASGGHTWLAQGDLAARTLTVIADGVECPSLSPDGTQIAYKKNVSTGATAFWNIAVRSVRGDTVGEEHVLAETRNVDDQVEWLDNDTVLYGLPRSDTPGDNDVWSLLVDGSGAPALFIEHAWSPSVIR